MLAWDLRNTQPLRSHRPAWAIPLIPFIVFPCITFPPHKGFVTIGTLKTEVFRFCDNGVLQKYHR